MGTTKIFDFLSMYKSIKYFISKKIQKYNEEFIESITDAEIHEDVMGSDHCPVSIELIDNF